VPYFVLGKVVAPNKIGIRQNFFGIPGVVEDGYQPVGLEPGLHWQIPFLSVVHLLPRDFIIINFSSDAVDNTPSGKEVFTRPRLEIPTRDGSKVRADITLVARFFDRPNVDTRSEGDRRDEPYMILAKSGIPIPKDVYRYHGGPVDLVNKYRFGLNDQMRIFTSTAEDFIRKRLSALSTVDYYNPVLRERAALEANELVNTKSLRVEDGGVLEGANVNADGVLLWATLIRRYQYSKQEIDDKIFNKIFQEQYERRLTVEEELEEQNAITRKELREMDAKIDVLKSEGNKEETIIKSGADLYRSQRVSEGQRLIEEARARVTEEKNRILAQLDGSKAYVAKEMLPIIDSLQGGVISGVDPFDVDQWLNKLGSE
jgi:hypothetical protein